MRSVIGMRDGEKITALENVRAQAAGEPVARRSPRDVSGDGGGALCDSTALIVPSCREKKHQAELPGV